MSQQDLLAPVRAVLSSAAAWTKLTYARDAAGNACAPVSDEAVCWCLLGAIEKAYPTHAGSAARQRLASVLRERAELQYGGLAGWQDEDSTTFERVQALLAEPVAPAVERTA